MEVLWKRPAIRDRYAKPTGRYSPTHPGINYGIEAAPTAQGPFLPYQDLATPGANQMTLPASEFMRFLRLAPKP